MGDFGGSGGGLARLVLLLVTLGGRACCLVRFEKLIGNLGCQVGYQIGLGVTENLVIACQDFATGLWVSRFLVQACRAGLSRWAVTITVQVVASQANLSLSVLGVHKRSLITNDSMPLQRCPPSSLYVCSERLPFFNACKLNVLKLSMALRARLQRGSETLANRQFYSLQSGAPCCQALAWLWHWDGGCGDGSWLHLGMATETGTPWHYSSEGVRWGRSPTIHAACFLQGPDSAPGPPGASGRGHVRLSKVS